MPVNPNRIMHPRVRTALYATGLPWEVRNGGNHFKVYLAGKMACILPNNCSEPTPRQLNNTLSYIRKAARGG